MLFTPVNTFGFAVNNYGDDVPGASGTTVTADASANTKGTEAALLAGIAQDCYYLFIHVSNGNTSNDIRRQLIDIVIDPAAGIGNAGSSWSVLINNLYTNGPSNTVGFAFEFPIFIKAGTAIGARTQDTLAGGSTCKVSICVLGKPSRPELVKVGSTVQTLGAGTATTSGFSVSPGNLSWGSYSSTLGTLTNDAWWWQMGWGTSDASSTIMTWRFDIAADATAKYKCINALTASTVTTTETWSKPAHGIGPSIRAIKAGSDVYARAQTSTAPDTSCQVCVYALS